MADLVKVELDQIVATIHENYKKTATALIEIGRGLLRAKELLPHGEWGGWLDANFGLSQSSATNFMRVAKEFGDRAHILNGCDFGSRVLYALAAPSVDEGVREIAIHEAQEGATPDLSRIQDLKTQTQTQAQTGTYVGETVKALSGPGSLGGGETVELTGAAFPADPRKIYVRCGGGTFLVWKDEVRSEEDDQPGYAGVEAAMESRSLGKRRMPSGDVVELLADLGDSYSVKWEIGGAIDDVPKHLLLPLNEPKQKQDASPVPAIPFALGELVIYQGRPEVVGVVQSLNPKLGTVRVNWPTNAGIYGSVGTSADLLRSAPPAQEARGFLIEVVDDREEFCHLPVRFAGTPEELIKVIAAALENYSAVEVVDVEEQEAAAIAYHMVFGGADGTD